MRLVPHPDGERQIRSSYNIKGKTRADRGGLVPFEQLRLLNDQSTGRATPGMWRALLAVEEALDSLGAEGQRVTELYRPWAAQERSRNALQAWIDAGRPKQGEPGWQTGMRTSYVAEPGESGHGWGGSVDWHVYALRFPGLAVGSDQALSRMWDVVRPLGFRPIIREPKVNQAECWHFDRFGPLERVRTAFYSQRNEGAQYRNAYGNTMVVGHLLVGTYQGDRVQERYMQALILLAGGWCGVTDGRPGKLTKDAYRDITGKAWPSSTNEAIAELSELDDVKRGLQAL